MIYWTEICCICLQQWSIVHRGTQRNRNFVIKHCVFIFRCYKLNLLQSTVHLMQCTSLNMFSTFQSSPETPAKWCLLMPPSFFFFTSSTSAKRFPLRTFFIRGNKKKSHRARSGEYGGWRSWVMLFWVKNLFTLKALCAGALSWWSHQLFSFAIPRSKSVGRNSRTHQTNQQDCQLFCDGLPRSVHEFSRCFHPFGRSRVALSEVGLQVTIHHSW